MVSTGVALGITVATLTLFTVLGLWYSRGRIHSVEDLISARNSSGSGTTTATLIATGMGAWILFAPAEAGAAFGGIAAITGYALGTAIPFIAFIWIGVRVRRLIPDGHSLTEYVHARFGPTMYLYVLVITMFYMFIFLAAEMTGIAGALALVAGVPPWQTATLIGAFVLVYTAYGGLIASIFTDTIQTLVILPLLAIGFAGAILALGGTSEIHADVTATTPELLDPTFLPGLEFGAYVTIAILAANMFNQGIWQRIFAAKDEQTVKRSFGIAAIAVVPMIFLAGLFGVVASGRELLASPGDGSIAFFLVLLDAFPEWVVFAIVLLAVLLVMSTADTMFNAIASIITADLRLLVDTPSERTLTLAARGVTIVAAAGAIFVGAQGYSVLELFLLADLLAAATVFPFLSGLYLEGVRESGALLASLAALAVGLAYFPITHSLLVALPLLGDVLPAPSFLAAFAGAAALSTGLTLLTAFASDRRFDVDRLDEEIHSLDRVRGDGGRHRPQVEQGRDEL